jgi:SAM-dependent methyltransferase
MYIYQFKRRQAMSEKTTQSEKIRGAVRQRYGQIAREFEGMSASCCGPSDCCGEAGSSLVTAEAFYATPDVAELPFDATDMSLGCGDPVTLAGLQPGETVLDLGSGGGIDCFLAAKQVGPDGYVIGVDMTSDMIEKARANARNVGVDNVEFRLGEIEHLPVSDESVDVVISNCVINLSPDKPQVFRETYRALRPGGRLAVSDIVTRVELPPKIKQDLGSWAACLAGTWTDEDYVAAIEGAGFVDVTIQERKFEDSTLAEAVCDLEIDPATAQNVAYSASITARRPD